MEWSKQIKLVVALLNVVIIKASSTQNFGEDPSLPKLYSIK
jgi:hypothetical protein